MGDQMDPSGHEGTPADRNLSRIVSRERRASGTGSISHTGDYWVAKVTLRDGRRPTRKRWTEEEAEAALADLIREYRDQLGYHYQWPRPFRPGELGKRPRSGVTPRVRFLVLSRDGFRCVYCGTTAAESSLHVDHVLAVANGGSDEMTNLVTACAECNQGKAALLLEEHHADA